MDKNIKDVSAVLEVDEIKCKSCYACIDNFPDIFRINDIGKAFIKKDSSCKVKELKEITETCNNDAIKFKKK